MNQENKSDQTIPYVRNGDYYFPDLALPPDVGDIGFWGRLRREYLREHRPILFNQMALSGERLTTLPCSIRKQPSAFTTSLRR